MKRLGMVIACMMLAGAPLVAVQAANKIQINASMLVTGTVTLSKKGVVAGYHLDHQDKLPKVVVRLLSGYIPRFRFKPTVRHGKAVAGIAAMTLRLLARQMGKDHYTVSVAGYQFGSTDPALLLKEEHVSHPHYPPNENGRVQVGGIVYLFLQVNRDGHVTHAYAQQVNLTQTPGDPRFISGYLLQRWRRDFAYAAVQASMTWTFKIPRKEPQASQPYWYARIPVQFSVGSKHHSYGEWMSYIPGPRKPIPWLKHRYFASGASGSVDAQVPGTVHTINPHLQLEQVKGQGGS